MSELPYRVEPMTPADLERVGEIEAMAHAAPWPTSAYRHELEQNHMAHYLVLLPQEPSEHAPSGLRERLRGWLRRPHRGRPLLGYAGFWLMVGEAHVSTIALDPEWRGLGLGELLLWHLLDRAREEGAHLATLEVRQSNQAAQNLYRKYHFEYVGMRKRYYRDNNEDAHIMTVEGIAEPPYRAFLQERWGQLEARLARQEGTNGRARGGSALGGHP